MITGASAPFYEVNMSPTVIMSREFTNALTLRKMQRDSYAKWKENERKARERAERLKCR